MGDHSREFDIAVIGGAGHVGAPLAIMFAKSGLRTAAIDINHAALDLLNSGRLLFMEDGGEPLLREVLAEGRITFADDPSLVRGVPTLVIAIGTPIDEFHNPRLDAITRCIDGFLPYLSHDQTIILCSTVFPGVTEFVARYLEAKDCPLPVAFCPERVVQGQAIHELGTLPQIISGTSPQAVDAAERVFLRFAPRVIRMGVREAEFAKLITNAYRYIQFAAANQFYMMVESAGVDYAKVFAGLKQDYPRMSHLPSPGFAAGPCLMKDTMQLVAFDNGRFPLGSLAMTINEGLPNFIVERLRQLYDLTKTRVGILGMAFKADIDDIRESLSYKLGKILQFRGATVLYSDEYVKDPTFIPADELVRNSDIVLVGVPHRAYRTLTVPDSVHIVDLWGVLPPNSAWDDGHQEAESVSTA